MSAIFEPILRRLETTLILTEEERAALVSLPMRIVELRASQDIVREGDRPSRCVMVLDGVVCTSKIIGDGKRQIMAFYIAGDMPDLQSLHLEILDNDLVTVTNARVGLIDHAAITELCSHFPRITAAFWRVTLVDSAIFREWVANIGQRGAKARLAHVFCEMMLRMRSMGLSDGETCDLPLTQSVLAEATGMSIVHVNRSLQDLRKSGHMSFARGILTVHNWPALTAVADFDAGYLHIPVKPAMNGNGGNGHDRVGS